MIIGDICKRLLSFKPELLSVQIHRLNEVTWLDAFEIALKSSAQHKSFCLQRFMEKVPSESKLRHFLLMWPSGFKARTNRLYRVVAFLQALQLGTSRSFIHTYKHFTHAYKNSHLCLNTFIHSIHHTNIQTKPEQSYKRIHKHSCQTLTQKQ